MKKQRQNAGFAGTDCARTGFPIFMGNLLPTLAARACFICLIHPCPLYPPFPAFMLHGEVPLFGRERRENNGNRCSAAALAFNIQRCCVAIEKLQPFINV